MDNHNPSPEPANQTPASGDHIARDKHIHGDEVHGDKVMGDKIVRQAAPAFRTPLQRPPRPEHFVNRETALAQLLADLQPGRVVTLCGPGGIGKTALAAEAIWRLAPGDQPPGLFPDGILAHNFYRQPQVALLFEKIALSFGEELRPAPSIAAQRALAGRRVLLLLDGAEQADDLPAVLAIRDRCGVLVTSRSHADAVSDWQDVTPLPPDETITLLQAWGLGRAADTETARRICALVDYLPLAVRLAGSYLSTRARQASEYARWLEQTPLATLENRKRQQDSVPLLLERSLAQVSEAARQVMGVAGLLALAPFDEAAIAAALDQTTRIARALDELVNYSLLVRRAQAFEVTPYLIHIYARESVSPCTEVVSRLAAYYTTMVKDHPAAFDILNSARPHIMALLQACCNREIWTDAYDFARAIEEYLDLQGYWTDRVMALKFGLAAARALQDRQKESAELGNLGLVYADLGQVKQAIAHFQQSLTIAQEIGDRRCEGSQLGNLANACLGLGQVDQAIANYQQSLTIAQEIGDRGGEGANLGNLGNAYFELGQVEQAIAHYHQAIAIAREFGDRRNDGTWLGNLGTAYRTLGKVEQAIACYQQALTIAQEIGDRRNEGNQLGNLANAYADLGQVDQAVVYYQQSLTIAQEIGDRRAEAAWLANLGIEYADLGQVDRAVVYYQQSLTIAQEIGDKRSESSQLGNLANAYADLGQVNQAIVHYHQALAIAQAIGDRHKERNYLGNLGIACADLGQIEQAIAYYHQALTIAKEIGDRRNEGAWLGNLGSAYYSLGQVAQAIGSYQQALTIAKEIGDRPDEGAWLANLGVAYNDLGQLADARQAWQQALHIYQEIKSPNADTVRQSLASLDSS